MRENLLTVKPVDAQSDPFFSAVSSALLPALGITEKRPYWCSPQDRYCIDCGKCGERTSLQKHQLALYHVLLTVSGVGLCFDYPEDDGLPFHTLPGASKGWRWPNGFLERLFSFAGVNWKRFGAGEEEAFLPAAERSFSRGVPVLLRGGRTDFGEDTFWSLGSGLRQGCITVTDFERTRETAVTFRPEGNKPEASGSGLCEAIVFTGAGPRSLSYFDVLEGMTAVLAHPSHRLFENSVYVLLREITVSNAAEVAEKLCGMAGVSAEARWHTAETFCSKDNLLTALSGNEGLKADLKKLVFDCYIRDGTGETHGVCWKIWELLGASPKTNFRPGPDAGAKLLDPMVRKDLRALWQQVFDNDRTVLNGIREILRTYRTDI